MNRLMKQKRRERGFSAAETAEQAGTTEMRIYAFERDRFRPKVQEAHAIAAVLGCTAEELFPGMFPTPAAPHPEAKQ